MVNGNGAAQQKYIIKFQNGTSLNYWAGRHVLFQYKSVKGVYM